ncbi:MAG: hypothetical protein WBC60_18745 [Cognaticolwellia sp.]
MNQQLKRLPKYSTNQVIGVFGIIAFILLLLVWADILVIPADNIEWIAFIVFGIPLWFLLAWLGGTVLLSKFIKNRSSFSRIILGILLLGLLLLGVMFVISMLVQKTIIIGG